MPDIIICDNAKALVVDATVGNQKFAKKFAKLSKKYGFKIQCARPSTPTDKGFVENAVGRITRAVIKKIKPCSLKTIEDVQLRLNAAVELINGSADTKTHIVPWDDFRKREQSELKPLPELPWTRWGTRHHRVIDEYGCVNMDGHKYLCKPEYDLGTIDLVVTGPDDDDEDKNESGNKSGNKDGRKDGNGERKILFLRPGTDKILWDYPYYEKGRTHPTEGTRHFKTEFRMVHEVTAVARLANAKQRVASMGEMAAKFATAFAKANEHKAPGMVAQQFDWIYGKLKDEDKDIAEHAFMHSLGIGKLDQQHLVFCVDLIKKFIAKSSERESPASTRGACLHSVESLVPPAPVVPGRTSDKAN